MRQWQSIVDVTRKPERIDLDPKFFFYDPDGTMEWAPAYYNSNYHTGHLPRPGMGMLHQHWTVRHDWHTWLLGMAWARGEREADKEADALLTNNGGWSL